MATIQDVAEKAGVSVKTVSRYLSGFEGISAKTVSSIEQATKDLEFFPSAAARSLRGQSSGIISLIADNLTTGPLSVDIVKGVHDVCEKRNKLLLIGETGRNQHTFNRLVDRFRQQKTEAIIKATDHHTEIKVEQKFKRCPLVLLNCFDRQREFPSILPDDRKGAYEVTKHLIANGHRNILNITLPEGLIATGLRRQGFEQAMREADIPVNPQWVITAQHLPPKEDMEWLQSVLENVLAAIRRPTAILCGNDKMAFRVMMILHALRIDTPQDISVVGYDDFKLISENTVPALTTVSLPYYQMGVAAAETALDMAETNAVPTGVQLMDCRLIKRESDREL